MLPEPADAADVVQDTFVIAVPRMSALRDPQRLRPWLYTVARNECLRKLRSSSLQAPLEEAPEVTDEGADVEADVEKAELRALVRDALPGVAAAEQEVLELQLRHGLAADEMASVLGVPATTRTRSCPGPASSWRRPSASWSSRGPGAATARSSKPCWPFDGQLTVLLRKRINRHVERCAICSSGGRRR